MEADQLPEETADDQELVQEAAEPRTKFVLTPRLEAIARGEDPDAPVAEPEVEEVETDAEEVAADEAATETAEDETPAPTSWVTPSDRQRAVAYGLDPEDLDGYSSREEFGKVTRAIDKAASRWEPTKNSATLRNPEEAKPADAPVNDTDPVVNGKLNIAYYEKNFDEGTVEAMKVLRAQQEALEQQTNYLEQAREQQAQDEVNRQLHAFHQAVDAHRPDFFGSTVDKSGLPVSLAEESHARRARLLRATQLVASDILREQEEAGLQPSLPPYATLIRQAEQLAYGDEIAKHTKAAEKVSRAAQLKKVASQSLKRRGVSTTGSAHAAYRNAPAADPHSTESIMRSPAVAEVLRRFSDIGATN